MSDPPKCETPVVSRALQKNPGFYGQALGGSSAVSEFTSQLLDVVRREADQMPPMPLALFGRGR